MLSGNSSRSFPRLFPTFDFVWNITGIVLAGTSKTCAAVMPDVYHSILAFASGAPSKADMSERNQIILRPVTRSLSSYELTPLLN